jgi:Tfp pilus assembly protein PilO
MANKSHPRASVKRLQIDKSQSTMLITAAIAGFFLAFMLVGGKVLVDQIKYQNKVIGQKKVAVDQLRTNVQATTSLQNSYKAFVSTSQNVIGGNPQGGGAKDGDNAKIILDALPSKYDFPALASSLEKLITDQGLSIDTISGSDDELAQAEKESSPSPEPVAMPFQVSGTGTYASVQKLITSFNQSVRPFQMQTVEINGGQTNMSVSIDAQTFYQPAKNFNITKKVVK